MKKIRRCFAGAFFCSSQLFAQSSTWWLGLQTNAEGYYNWNNEGNWTAGIPGVDAGVDQAVFPNYLFELKTVTIDGTFEVSSLTFEGKGSWMLSNNPIGSIRGEIIVSNAITLDKAVVSIKPDQSVYPEADMTLSFSPGATVTVNIPVSDATGGDLLTYSSVNGLTASQVTFSGGIWNNLGTASINQLRVSLWTLNNFGTLYVPGSLYFFGGNTVTLEGNDSNIGVVNASAISVASGTTLYTDSQTITASSVEAVGAGIALTDNTNMNVSGGLNNAGGFITINDSTLQTCILNADNINIVPGNSPVSTPLLKAGTQAGCIASILNGGTINITVSQPTVDGAAYMYFGAQDPTNGYSLNVAYVTGIYNCPGPPLIALNLNVPDSHELQDADTVLVIDSAYGAYFQETGDCSDFPVAEYQEMWNAFNLNINTDPDSLYTLFPLNIDSNQLNFYVMRQPEALLDTDYGNAPPLRAQRIGRHMQTLRETRIHRSVPEEGLVAVNDELYVSSEDGFIAQERIPEQLAERAVERSKKPWSVYVAPTGAFGHISPKARFSRTSYHSVGAEAGFDYAWSNSDEPSRSFAYGLGAQVVYVNTLGHRERQGCFRVNQTAVNLYGTLVPKRIQELSLNTIIGTGYDWYHIHRNPTRSTTAHGNTGGPEVNALLGLEYIFSRERFPKIPKDFKFVPIATVQYAWAHVSGYREYGADSFNLKVKGESASDLWSFLGFRTNYEFRSQKTVSVRPEATVGWQMEYLDQTQRAVAVNTAGPFPQTYITENNEIPQSSLVVGADLRVRMYHKFQLEADYDLFWNARSITNAFLLELRGEF